MSGYDETIDEEFAIEILPQHALHYRREALYELEGKCPWLKVFTSVEPDFNEARDKFFSDGSSCMLNLEKHIELMQLAIANEKLTYKFGVLYIIFMAKLYPVAGGTTMNIRKEVGLEDKIEASIEKIKNKRDAIGKRSSAAGLVDSSDSFLEAGQQIVHEYGTRKTKFNNWLFKHTIISSLQEALKEDENYADVRVKDVLDRMKRAIGRSGSETYLPNVKKFTYHVGCPKAYEDPRLNIAALRHFHSTRMPFFQKLQGDLQAQIEVNNKQQEIITALVFRHLIEHLPPNPYKNKTNATDRWLAFWEDAVRTEYVRPTDHPLEGLVNEKVFPLLSDPLVEVSTKHLVTRNSTGRSVDRDFVKGIIDEVGEKAQTYRFGKELFGVMSKNIHAYETKGKEGYTICSDHWGKGVRDILERLVPKEFDRDDDNNDIVNWERERRRYVPTDGILLTTKAEVPRQAAKPGSLGKSGKPETVAQPYSEKLNGY